MAMAPDPKEGFLTFKVAAQAADRGLVLHLSRTQWGDLVAYIRGLEKALEPFLPLAADVDEYGHDDEDTCAHRIRAGDLRRARSALNGGEQS